MLKLEDCELFEIRGMTIISIPNPVIFKGRCTPDRYGKEALSKLKKYGKSLLNTKVEHNQKIYEVTGFEIMQGSVGYVGSLDIRVEQEKSGC